MLHAARKLAVRITLAIVGIGALAGAALAWRLSRGPLELPFVTPRIEAAFARVGNDTTAHVGRTELVWSRRQRPEIRVDGVRLFHSDGTPIAIFPDLSVWPSLRAALRGQFAVARVGLSGARMSLVRTEQGELVVGEGTMAEDVAQLITEVAAGRRKNAGPSYLWRIDIHEADLTLDDRKGKTEWRAEHADLGIRLRPGGLTVDLSTSLIFKSATDRFVGGAAMPLTATADVVLKPGGGVESVAFDVFGDRGQILPVADPDPPIELQSLFASGRYVADAAVVEVPHVQALIGTSALDMSGRVTIGSHGLVEAKGTIDSAGVVILTRLWPPGRWGSTREWIVSNIREGSASNARFALAIPYPKAPDEPFPDGAIELHFDVAGMTIDYLNPMDPMREVRGKAKLTEKTFEADVEHAVARTLSLRNGRIDIDTRAKPARAKVVMDFDGAVPEMIALLDRPPLRLPTKYKIPTSGTAGSGTVHAELALPLAHDIGEDDVHVVADAKLGAARLPDLFAGIGVDGGTLHVRVSGERLNVDGQAELTGAPAIQGPVRIDFTVDPKTDPAAPRRFRGTLEGADAAARGEVALDAEGLYGAALTSVRYGRTDVAADITRTGTDAYSVQLEGKTLDVEPLIDREHGGSEPSATAPIAWRLDVNVTNLLTGTGLDLVDVRGNASGKGEAIDTLSADGALPDGGAVKLDFKAGGDAGGLEFSSDQAGKVIKALGLHDDVTGGRLGLVATLEEGGGVGQGKGEIDISDFRVVRAPLLAKILSLASLEGIATLLGGEGIGFTHARIPISWSKEKIELRDARAVGALGLTADGAIDRTTKALSIRGQVIPAYTLNSALGKLPIIGNLLVGGEGKGIFGVDYSVQGTSTEPEVWVNPISVLAPGVLRELFVEPFTKRE